MSDISIRTQKLERKERLRALNERMLDLREHGYTGSLHSPEDKKAIERDICEPCGTKLRYLGAMVRLKPTYASIGFWDCPSCLRHGEF